MTDFTNCPILPGHAYNGANGNKIAISFQGEIYMLKFPPSGESRPTELSYLNSCISEHIGSTIFRLLGIKAQETILGTYTIRGKTRTVCACKDFTSKGKRLFDFCSIKNTIIDSETNGRGTELDEILDTIEKQRFVSNTELTKYFWDMFILDALLGNFDRHNGNWGFLYDENTEETSIAPIFDCGSCLLPQADDSVMKKVLSDEKELHARIFQFPTSAIKLHGNKINYYDFLTRCDNADCNEALLRIFPRIDMKIIASFIEDIDGITPLQKEFYQRYLLTRYDLILKPSYERPLLKNNH